MTVSVFTPWCQTKDSLEYRCYIPHHSNHCRQMKKDFVWFLVLELILIDDGRHIKIQPQKSEGAKLEGWWTDRPVQQLFRSARTRQSRRSLARLTPLEDFWILKFEVGFSLSQLTSTDSNPQEFCSRRSDIFRERWIDRVRGDCSERIHHNDLSSNGKSEKK